MQLVRFTITSLLALLATYVSASANSPTRLPKRNWGFPSYRGGSNIHRSENFSDAPSVKTPHNSAAFRSSAEINTTETSSSLHSSTRTNSTTPSWKSSLPTPLCDKTKTLQRIVIPHNGKTVEIFLLGTAHVSNDSSRDVQLLLETIEPDAIFVELCDQRIPMMQELPIQHNESTPFWKKVKDAEDQDMSKMQAIATILLTQVQEDYAKSLGVELGGEFRVAYRFWSVADRSISSRRPHLILGDRPLTLTLVRAWESLGAWEKMKVIFGLLFSCFQRPNPEELRKWIQSILVEESDVLSSSLAELRKHFPSLEKVIIQERDAYMACKLYQTSRLMLMANTVQSNIVVAAIVGAGHVPGICSWLTGGANNQAPEDVLSNLITTKKYDDQDLSNLIHDVSELPHIPTVTNI